MLKALPELLGGQVPDLRTRIFVDFWNLQLNIIEREGKDYRLDWRLLSPCLVTQAEAVLESSLRFEETRVYLSYNPRTDKGKKLRNWAVNVLDRFPGVRVTAKERKTKSPPVCPNPNCHKEIAVCPYCQGAMIGTTEKGIDTSIVTDIVSLAWENEWDIAILVSSDHDFVPCAAFLNSKGRRIINGHFPPDGVLLARTCWASFNLGPLLSQLRRPPPS